MMQYSLWDQRGESILISIINVYNLKTSPNIEKFISDSSYQGLNFVTQINRKTWEIHKTPNRSRPNAATGLSSLVVHAC